MYIVPQRNKYIYNCLQFNHIICIALFMIHCCKAASQKMNMSTLDLVVYSTFNKKIAQVNLRYQTGRETQGDAKRPLNELP